MLRELDRPTIQWKQYKTPIANNTAPLSNKPPSPLLRNKSLEKRAKAKYITYALALDLYKLDSPMKDKYQRTLNCARSIIQKGDKLTSHYCGCKWCIVCNRIRTGKLINKYLELTEKLNNPHFVTLTVRNIDYDPDFGRDGFINEMKYTQQHMSKHFKKVSSILKKYHVKLKGVRNFENIPTSDGNGSRPHIHWMIDGDINLNILHQIWRNRKLPSQWIIRESGRDTVVQYADMLSEATKTGNTGKIKGELIIQLWLQNFSRYADRKGQDCKPCEKGTEMELFKYSTKLMVNNKHKRQVPIRTLDMIYEATQSVRSINVTGFVMRKPTPPSLELPEKKYVTALKKYRAALAEYLLYKSLTKAAEEDINEDLESVDMETGEVIGELPPDAVYIWKGNNWYYPFDNSPLCGFKVEDSTRRFVACFNSS